MHDVPVLHRNDLSTSEGSELLVEALRNLGTVIITDIIPVSLEESTLNAVRALFNLAYHIKQSHAAKAPLEPGFGPHGQARALDTGIPNLLESWTFSDHLPSGIPSERAECWYLVKAYYSYLQLVGQNALLAIDRGLGLSGQLFRLHSNAPFPPQFFNYSTRISNVNPGARRQSVHVDSSIISILPRASKPGLRLFGSDPIANIGVHPPHGAVVLISGTVLDFLTSSSIPAARHTVEDDYNYIEEPDRISAIHFVNAASGQRVQPVIPRLDKQECEIPTLDIDQHHEQYREHVFGIK